MNFVRPVRDPILDALTDAVIVTGIDGIIRVANRAAEELSGFTEEALLGRPLESILSIEPLALESDDRSDPAQVPVEFRGRLRDAEGQSHPLSFSLTTAQMEFEGTDSTVRVYRLRRIMPWKRVIGGKILERPGLGILSRVSSRLGARPKLEKVLSTAIGALLDEFQAVVARVWLSESSSGVFHLKARGEENETPELLIDAPTEVAEIPIEVSEVTRSGIPFLVENPLDDSRFDSDWVREHGIVTLIALPLIVAEERSGVLVAGFSEVFTDEKLDALLGFTSLISAAFNDIKLLASEMAARDWAETHQRRLEAIVELMPIGVLLVAGPEARIALANPTCQRIFGRSLATFDLQAFTNRVPVRRKDGTPLPPEQRPLWLAFHNHERTETVLHYDHPELGNRVIETTAMPISGPDPGAICIYNDITDQSDLQSDLEMRATQQQALLHHMPVGVAYFGLDGYCRGCNNAALRILGLPKSSVLSSTVETLFEDRISPDASRLRSALALCLHQFEPHACLNIPWGERRDKRDDPDHYLDWRFEPLLTSTKKPIGALALIEDVTNRKLTSDAMQSAKEAAERSAKEKALFLSAISHDLRTPANALNLLANYLKQLVVDRPDDLDLAQLSVELNLAAGNLVELVTDVLDLSRFDSGGVTHQLLEFQLNEWLSATLAPLERNARQKGLNCEFALHSSVDRIQADRVKLSRILTNLVDNAIKFTESGSVVVEVSLPTSCELLIDVVDTGPGIPEEQWSVIFDEFAQLRNPERDRNKGTGLGLAICKRLVNSVGGSLNIESEPGVGSRFRVRYPITPITKRSSDIDRVELAGTESPALHSDHPLILLVEDDPTTRLPMIHLLELAGYRVIATQNGAEALKVLENSTPLLVLLDLMMPAMGGVEVLTRIRQNPKSASLPVLVVSGDILDEDRYHELELLGVANILAKPIDFDELLGAIDRMAENGAMKSPQRDQEASSISS